VEYKVHCTGNTEDVNADKNPKGKGQKKQVTYHHYSLRPPSCWRTAVAHPQEGQQLVLREVGTEVVVAQGSRSKAAKLLWDMVGRKDVAEQRNMDNKVGLDVKLEKDHRRAFQLVVENRLDNDMVCQGVDVTAAGEALHLTVVEVAAVDRPLGDTCDQAARDSESLSERRQAEVHRVDMPLAEEAYECLGQRRLKMVAADQLG
jgi:hypothetical protein